MSKHGLCRKVWGTSEELNRAHNAIGYGVGRMLLILLVLSCFVGRAYSACPTAGSPGATVSIQAGETCTLSPGNYSLSSLTVSGILVLETTEPSIVRIAVTNTLDVTSTGRISSDGQGYIHDSGPGAGVATSGGGHGGRGGHASGSFLTAAQSQAYGSATEPVLPGSGGGGGQGGAGGGAVHITAHTINVNGPISANGQDATGGNGGGGSGGSVYLSATSRLTGNADITATGGQGRGTGGGGGGGRVSISTPSSPSYTGDILTFGGNPGKFLSFQI
ncbi:uncharacterized protein LOC144879455 [Branchiostoma floridae x Branchiostoma japonicum]